MLERFVILRAQPQIPPIAICILISAALTKSTHSTQAWGCLCTIMHDNIKAFLYCLSSSLFPYSPSLSCYLELKAVVPLQILSVALEQILKILACQWFSSRLTTILKDDFILELMSLSSNKWISVHMDYQAICSLTCESMAFKKV